MGIRLARVYDSAKNVCAKTLRIHATEIFQLFWRSMFYGTSVFPLRSSAIILCTFLFFRLSPLHHPGCFKVRELDCRHTQAMEIPNAETNIHALSGISTRDPNN